MPDPREPKPALPVRVAVSLGGLSSALTLLLVCIAPRDLLACQCDSWSGPFLKVAHRADLAIRGTVLRYQGKHDDRGRRAMDVRVDEVLRGHVGSKEVRVWGGSGTDCRPEVGHFPISTEWIFAIYPSASSAGERGYSMSRCGGYWLQVKDGVAHGPIASPWEDHSESLRLDQLKALMQMGLRGLVPNTAPHLTGRVSAASAWSLDVLKERDGVPESTSARVFLTPSTTVIDRDGREYPPKTIPRGTQVSLWFPGPLAPFSAPKGEPFPISATVVIVVVEDAR